MTRGGEARRQPMVAYERRRIAIVERDRGGSGVSGSNTRIRLPYFTDSVLFFFVLNWYNS